MDLLWKFFKKNGKFVKNVKNKLSKLLNWNPDFKFLILIIKTKLINTYKKKKNVWIMFYYKIGNFVVLNINKIIPNKNKPQMLCYKINWKIFKKKLILILKISIKIFYKLKKTGIINLLLKSIQWKNSYKYILKKLNIKC